MTEAEWVGASSVTGPLLYVMARGSRRKLRLLAGAACDRAREHLTHPDSWEALEALISDPDWDPGAAGPDAAFRLARRAVGAARAGSGEQRWSRPREAAARAVFLGAGPGLAGCLDGVLSACRGARALAAPPEAEAEVALSEVGHQLELVRDVFGNPFRTVTMYRDWLTSTVTAMARRMYGSRDFDAMPILGDALQDAGCNEPDVLDHCRGPGPHVRGCWVVDLVLGKE